MKTEFTVNKIDDTTLVTMKFGNDELVALHLPEIMEGRPIMIAKAPNGTHLIVVDMNHPDFINHGHKMRVYAMKFVSHIVKSYGNEGVYSDKELIDIYHSAVALNAAGTKLN